MTVYVSKHAISRFKQRILKKKTTSGKKCVKIIKKQIKSAVDIRPAKHCDLYYYYTKDFIAVVRKNFSSLFVVTIFEKESDHIDWKSVS